MKLNMGCGNHHKDGYINVDKYPPADVIFDLDKIWDKNANFNEWPWPDNSIDEVIFHHSLEHMGATFDSFAHIVKELYRVCKDNAKISITVPHPKHDDFLNDPTHVRAITPHMLGLLNKADNEKWTRDGTPNTPLGLQLGVNFVISVSEAFVENQYKGWPDDALEKAITNYNNVIKQTTTILRVVK